MRRFEFHAPGTLDEALALLKRGDGVRLLAGGTDLLVHLKEGDARPSTVVSIGRLPELAGLTFDEAGGLRLGASTDMATIEASPVIRERYAALADGAGIVGSIQTRNMATVGGNIANAAPSADTAPPLVVFDAIAGIAGPNGRRELPVAELFAGPGQTVLAPDEILTGFRLPAPPPRTGSVYQRHTPRKIMDIAVVGVAVRLSLGDDGAIAEARICLGAVAPTVIRANDPEQTLTGQPPSEELFARAGELAQQAASPISDVRGSADFRRYLVGVMTKRCLAIALQRAQGS
jgi:carbon-monoxide dehydrogenase medium subunit